eukprot:XP_025008464.1 capping protein, Arp2/3 and myosin-I linker protein 3 isoform X15 [Gallus gallus]
MAPPAGDVSRELQESIRRALGRPRIHLLLRARLETKPRRLEERILVLTAWRLHLFSPTTPAKAEGSLSVLEIRCISATSPTQVRLDTERGPLALALATPAAAACLARELGAALGRALPCAPPVWTLPPAPPLDTSPTSESSASSGPSVCGGFSDTYAALCDYNGLSCREEVQWGLRLPVGSSAGGAPRPTTAMLGAAPWAPGGQRPGSTESALPGAARGTATATLAPLWPGGTRKTREVPPTLQQFFCSTFALSHISLAGVRLPPDALRSLLQGLAANTHLSDLHLDLSGCELRSPGARVLEELLGGISAVGSLDLSDNGFDADLLTLVPALGRNKALKHLWLGKNFSVKARTLEEILHKLVQVIQEDDCSLQSLSVAESRLKARTCILVNALGSNACLTKVDLSGNLMEDMGAKMLAKALQINSTLRSLSWDRNNTTAVGFQDIARAMESNHTLTFMALPLCDLTAAYRSAPERTDTGWQQIQWCLLRNGRGPKVPPEQVLRLQRGIVTSTAEQGCCQGDVLQMLCRLSGRVQAAARGLRGHPGAQRDLAEAQELLREARNARALFPSLAALGPAGAGAGPLQLLLQGVAGDVAKAVDKELEVLLEALLGRAAELCPRATAAGVWPGGAWLGGAPRPRPPLPPGLAPGALLERAGEEIREQLGEVQLALVTSLTQAVVAELLRELRRVHQALAQHLQDPRSPQGQEPSNSTDEELGVDVDASTLQRHRRCCRRNRPPSAFMGQSEGLESPSPPRSSEGDPKPHPLHFRAPEAQAVGGSSQEEEFGRLPPTVPPYPQEHDCSPSSEASAPPEAGSPGLEWVGLPSPQTPPPQAPPRMGAWPPHSCGGEGGGGAIPEALPAAPTGEGCPRRRDSGRGREGSRGTSDRSRQLPPPKPQRRQRAHSCDKADAGPGPGGGGEAAAVL